MEIAIVAGIVIVAIVAMTGGGNSQTAPPPPAPDTGAAGNLLATGGGPAAQILQEQPGSTAGQAGSGSMAPSGYQPPVASRTPIVMPRQPVRVPVNVAPAPRVRDSGLPANWQVKPAVLFGKR
jgi:hypothetical protein